jgi:P-type Cu+ transporter
MFKMADRIPGLKCSHCGDECPDNHPVANDKHFCCNGCEVVHSLLLENGMDAYYSFEANPGISKRSKQIKNYDFLESPDVIEKLLVFHEGNKGRIILNLPQIHCVSCLWLLENLHKLDDGVHNSRVDFLKKEASITFNTEKLSLKKLVELLALIGYEPELSLQKLDEKSGGNKDRTLLYKLGLAGFSFGNIMLLSFPEYLGFAETDFRHYLGYINIVLALPVLLYSGFDYLRSAWWTLKLGKLDIDIPIAVGMLTLFFRSTYEILSHTGEGYIDSLAGFVFFLLIGKWFQQYTFRSISFDRDFKSYFPISAHLKNETGWTTVTLDKLVPGDVIAIRNEEIIPADGVIVNGNAKVDYSFVTGESDMIPKYTGDKVFAGGKHTGTAFELVIAQKVNQSYLTKLWEEDSFSSDKDAATQSLINKVGKYFTITILIIGIMTLAFWLWYDPSLAFNSFTAVLIVACPCALALAIPFTYGNILRILGNHSFFLKSVKTIERIQSADHIIFDKTGTITDHKTTEVSLKEGALTDDHKSLISSVVAQSNHPASRAIYKFLDIHSLRKCDDFQELPGSGLIAEVGGHTVRIGSAAFIHAEQQHNQSKAVWVEIDGKIIACFETRSRLRDGLESLVHFLGKKYRLSVISGDNESEKSRLTALFPESTEMKFNQSPSDKLNYIKSLQKSGEKVIMIGDGLNDAGALRQSDAGIVISDESNNFTPACDAIISADRFGQFLMYLTYIQKARQLIFGAFILAFLYNTIGLYFAVSGKLSPVIAAILMPLSSVTVMVYGVISGWLLFVYYKSKGYQTQHYTAVGKTILQNDNLNPVKI